MRDGRPARATGTRVAVLRARLPLLFWFVLLAVACRTAPAAADEEQSPCLSGRVGEILSERLTAHAFDGTLPAGWMIQEVSVAPDHVDLSALDERGHLRRIALRRGRSVPRVPDGRGRWFTFVIDSDGTPLDDAGRQGLLDLAVRVEAAIPEEEATRVCNDAPPGILSSGVIGGSHGGERAGELPRWFALPVGVGEVIVVIGALIFARRSRRGDPRSTTAHAIESLCVDLAVFLLAWLVIHAAAGSSPVVWLDTINDQRDVRRCLVEGACTSLGEATSVRGLHHAVGWLDFLSIAAFGGLGLDALHMVLQALTALGVTLCSATARRTWGKATGAFAALACLYFTGAVNQRALYNSTPLFFLGAVFLLVGAASAKRPGPASIALTASIGAVLASVHSACVLSVISVVWIAGLAPRHRGKLACLGAAVFVAAALVIGPDAWITSIRHLVSATVSPGSVPRSAAGDAGAALKRYAVLVSLALAARFLTRPEKRRVADVALAIALPMLAASFAAAAASTVPTNDKYLAHVVPSLAVLLTWLVAGTVDRISRVLGLPDVLLSRAALGAAALLYTAMAVFGVIRLRSKEGRAQLSFREAAAVPRELAARGWTYAQVYRSLRSQDSASILESFEILAPDFPVGPAPDDPTVVYVARVETNALPKPLPEGWVVGSQEGDAALVLVFVKSFLSWNRFAICDPQSITGPDTCVEGGLSLRDDEKPVCVYCVPGMPPFQHHGEEALELRMTVGGAPGETHAILMPSRALLCGGTIARVPAGPAAISDNRRRATWLEPTGSTSSGEVRLDWTIGSSECDMNSYSGLPPLFLEGDPRTVELLDRLGF